MSDSLLADLKQQVSNLSAQILALSTQQTVLMHGLRAVLQELPNRHAVADLLRDYVREELDTTSQEPDQAEDSAMTLMLATLLEAAGKPPRR